MFHLFSSDPDGMVKLHKDRIASWFLKYPAKQCITTGKF